MEIRVSLEYTLITDSVEASTAHRARSRVVRGAVAGVIALALGVSVRLAAQAAPAPPVDDFTGKPRVIVISDIGNEPDDQMSLVRFLVYSNEFDVEELIATTSTWQKTATHPETMRALIQAYGQVRPNLLLHAKGWPTAEVWPRVSSLGSLRMAWRQRELTGLRMGRRQLFVPWIVTIRGQCGSLCGAERTRWHRL